MATLRDAAMRDPSNYEVWQQIGVHEYSLGDYESAYSDFRQAVRVSDGRDASYSMYSLGLVTLRLKRPAEAEDWARRAIAADSRIPSYHLALASILETERRPAEAQHERQVAASMKR